MRSPDGTARIPCWQRRRAGRDPAEASGSGEPKRPLPHGAKDFLGLAFTAAIIGAILLFATNGLASPCRAAPGPRPGLGACSGIPAVANHVRGIGTLCVAACAVLAVITFVWYMFWGYKINGQLEGDRDG
ncbi:MAG: hypothetical protein ACTHPS_08455 [Streptosporangiaceae bacterium]